MHVKELDLFLTMKILENTSASLSLGKLCDETGNLMNGSMVKNHISLENWILTQCNPEKIVPIVVPGLSTKSSSGSDHSTSLTQSS